VLDQEGTVQAYRTDSSWPFSEACVGKPARAVEPEPLGRLLERLCLSAAESNGSCVVEEIRFRSADGTRHHLSVRFGPLAAQPDVYAAAVRDVVEVESPVQELTREADRVQGEKRELEEALGRLAHDLRSPVIALHGLLARLERLAAGELSERNAELLRHCRAAIEHLEDVVQSALEKGPRSRGPASTSVLDLAASVLLELQCAQGSVPFTYTVEGPSTSAAIPDYVLWRVLWNLAANAVAYRCPERPLHLTFRTWVASSRCILEFRDNGLGLAAGEEEAIFARGGRGSNVRHLAGSGLGLYQARGQIEEWAGQLWAEARPKGVAFLISLPCAKEP
jgi:signal transduction histidine kinase